MGQMAKSKCIQLFVICSLICLGSCNDPDLKPESQRSDVIFYTDTDWGCGAVNLTLEGFDQRSLTTFFSSGNPDCSNTPEIKYLDVPVGVYNYSATSAVGCTWSGMVNVIHPCTIIAIDNFEDNCANWTENSEDIVVDTFTGPGNSFNVTVLNKNSSIQKVFVCIENLNGTWSRLDAKVNGLGANEVVTLMTATSTGNFKVFAMEFEIFNTFNCPGPQCI